MKQWSVHVRKQIIPFEQMNIPRILSWTKSKITEIFLVYSKIFFAGEIIIINPFQQNHFTTLLEYFQNWGNGYDKIIIHIIEAILSFLAESTHACTHTHTKTIYLEWPQPVITKRSTNNLRRLPSTKYTGYCNTETSI